MFDSFVKQEDPNQKQQQLQQQLQLKKIQSLETESAALRQDVTKLSSVMALQAQQMAKQETLLNELRDERAMKAKKKLSWGNIYLFVLVVFVGMLFLETPALLKEDTVLRLHVTAIPKGAKLIKTPVITQFTIGDVLDSLKSAQPAAKV